MAKTSLNTHIHLHSFLRTSYQADSGRVILWLQVHQCSPFFRYFLIIVNVSEKFTTQLLQNWRKIIIFSNYWFAHVFLQTSVLFHSSKLIRLSSFKARFFIPCEGNVWQPNNGAVLPPEMIWLPGFSWHYCDEAQTQLPGWGDSCRLRPKEPGLDLKSLQVCCVRDIYTTWWVHMNWK